MMYRISIFKSARVYVNKMSDKCPIRYLQTMPPWSQFFTVFAETFTKNALRPPLPNKQVGLLLVLLERANACIFFVVFPNGYWV